MSEWSRKRQEDNFEDLFNIPSILEIRTEKAGELATPLSDIDQADYLANLCKSRDFLHLIEKIHNSGNYLILGELLGELKSARDICLEEFARLINPNNKSSCTIEKLNEILDFLNFAIFKIENLGTVNLASKKTASTTQPKYLVYNKIKEVISGTASKIDLFDCLVAIEIAFLTVAGGYVIKEAININSSPRIPTIEQKENVTILPADPIDPKIQTLRAQLTRMEELYPGIKFNILKRGEGVEASIKGEVTVQKIELLYRLAGAYGCSIINDSQGNPIGAYFTLKQILNK